MAVLLGTAVLQSGPEGVDPAELTNALAGLVDPGVAEAVLSECIGAERVDAPALAEAAQVLEGLARRTSRVALRWMRGKALERMGAVAPAEQVLGEAESLDPAWSPVLFDLARYASDRGDAARGLSLLERAGAASDDQLVALLERFRPNDDELGRNDPCWCGSGRKLKQCHRGPAPRSLAERATWLYQKALWFLQDGPWRGDLVDLAYLRSADWDEEHAVLRAMADPIVGDALLFEGGAFEEFVAERGFLLPADELALAQEWLLVKRSVFEIDDVRAGQGMTVLDVRTGDRHEVSDRVVSRVLMPGDLICARIVPAGQTRQGFGGIEPVDPAQRDELVALLNAGPGPFEVVGFLSARFARPHIDDAAPKPELDPK
jgi:hypothetical protein